MPAIADLQAALKARNLESASADKMKVGDSDFTPQMLRAKNAGADTILTFANSVEVANALKAGSSGSEGDLRRSLTELIGRYDGRVAVACFASNVARLSTISHAARANDRDVALIGRSLWRMDKAARENGYLADLPRFLTEDEAGYVPREKILLICTGSPYWAKVRCKCARTVSVWVELQACSTTLKREQSSSTVSG